MREIKWKEVGQHKYETGVDQGVLYPTKKEDGGFAGGVAWNGLITVSESPSGAEASPLYASNGKYLNMMSVEEFGCSIEAYMSPEEFDECDGTKEIAPGVSVGQQTRKVFGLSYRTLIGNDTLMNDYGYKIHLVYNGLAAPSEKGYSTVNDSPEAMTLSWEVSTTPVPVPDAKPTASLVIDSTKTTPDKMKLIEDILYGTAADGETPATEPRLPLPEEIITLMSA